MGSERREIIVERVRLMKDGIKEEVIRGVKALRFIGH
jgi:hypothetical protein